jgi:hypothetical protein
MFIYLFFSIVLNLEGRILPGITDRHDITEALLKVALNTITLTLSGADPGFQVRGRT